MSTQVESSVHDGVGLIELAVPDRGNAWSWAMCEALESALDRVDDDPAVRAVVLAGRGRNFCVGMDIRALGTLGEAGHPLVDGAPRDSAGRVVLRMVTLRKPLVAAVHGASMGVGTTMTLGADVRVAAEGTRFGLPFTRLGVVPEGLSSWLLPRVVGLTRALDWVTTGRTIDADEALRAGLVTRLVPDGQQVESALEIARQIAMSTSPSAVAASRQLMWRMLACESPWEAHRLESALLARAVGEPDAQEAAVAFLEKRPATFSTDIDDWFGAAPWHGWGPYT